MKLDISVRQHCVELQSLRGLAAYTVLIGHCLGVYFDSNTLFGRILQIPFNGNGAVVLFFVLSGFVLSFRLTRERLGVTGIVGYLIARVFRIHPLLMLASIIGTLYVNLWHVPNAFATEWYRSIYTQPIGAGSFISSAIGFGGRAAPPMWSIWVEIVGSTAMLAMALASFRGTAFRLLVGLILLLVSFTCDGRFGWPVYMLDFYLGMSLHWWSATALRRLSDGHLKTLLLLSTAFLMVAGAFFDDLSRPVFNILEMIPAMFMIAAVYHSRPRWLRHPCLVIGGDISYSAYLLHFIIMAMLISGYSVMMGGALLPWFLLVTATFVIANVVSLLTFTYIERPFIALGRTVSSAITAPTTHLRGSVHDKAVP